MDAQQFLAEFGHIANAPNGIARLRELILALAVQGRLVEQLGFSEPAALQVERIRRIANERPAIGRRKKTNALEANSFLPSTVQALPKGWVNVPLCHLARVLNGRAYSKSELLESGTPVLRVGNLFTSDKWYYSNLELEEDKYCDNGDLLYAWSASFGPFIWSGEKVIYHYHIWKLDLFSSTELNKNYLFTYLLEKTQEIKAAGHGISMAHMTKERFDQLSVLLPPLEEQSRIVAKVDELMALCDTLEAQQQARRKLQNKLRQSTLQAVASATSPHELQTTWARLADNFERLFNAPEDTDDLRNLILDLSANGFVSEPQTGDSDPLTIISQASSQQKVGFSARELREISALPELTHENGRFRIALGRIVKLVSGQHLSPEEYNTRRDGTPYITGPAEFKDRRPSPTKWTTERRAIARAGDVLITVKGSGVGKTALCDLEELAISRQLMAIRALADLDRRYLSICIDSAERRFQERKFGIAIPGIGRDEVLALPVLLPSVEEQGRIVHRLDELMRLCDSLELQLRSAQKVAGRLVIAAISSLTGIAIEQEEESVKVPQTELIAPLRLGTAPDIKALAPLATILARHNGEIGAKDLWQRWGLDKTVDEFYAQLKTEVAHGWILEPAPAEMREKPADAVSA